MNNQFIANLVYITSQMPTISVYGKMCSLVFNASTEVCELAISLLKDNSDQFKQTVGPGVDNTYLTYKFETLNYKPSVFTDGRENTEEAVFIVMIDISNPSKDADWYYGDDKNKVKRTVKVVIYN